MTTAENITKEEFIIEMTIISPINDIITKLENKEYRDCDVDWLDEKLQYFTSIALDILNIKLTLTRAVSGVMNDYNYNRFLKYFSVLLKFFKRYK